MADYQFNFTKGYDSAGNESFLIGHSGAPGASLSTLTDQDAGSSSFETTDTAMDDVPGSIFEAGVRGRAGTYLGSFTQVLDGQSITFLVVQDNTRFGIGNGIHIFANIPASVNLTGDQVDALLPDTLPTLNTDPFAVCFAAGTLIATPDGERPVEALAIGDLILTAEGRAVPVKWMGRQTLVKLFTPAHRYAPVRVRAGALGGGLPHADLVLTAGHALILDGLAIDAGALVNGTTIVVEPMAALPDRVTYFHIETEGHEVILANGAPAETFVDQVTRRAFDNFAEYEALFGEETVIDEMPLPRVSAARLVPPAIRARLAGAVAA